MATEAPCRGGGALGWEFLTRTSTFSDKLSAFSIKDESAIFHQILKDFYQGFGTALI